MIKSSIGARQSGSVTSTSWPRAGTRSGLVGGSSSILTVGELRACTKIPAGTGARLEPVTPQVSVLLNTINVP